MTFKKGTLRIVLGVCLIFIQIVMGLVVGFNFRISFGSFWGLLYDLVYSLGANILGVFGIILLIWGIIDYLTPEIDPQDIPDAPELSISERTNGTVVFESVEQLFSLPNLYQYNNQPVCITGCLTYENEKHCLIDDGCTDFTKHIEVSFKGYVPIVSYSTTQIYKGILKINGSNILLIKASLV